jgi:L-fucose isomerase-like protein
VETVAEGQLYADWLKRQTGAFDGVIVSLPNFGDETGAVTALRDAEVPILVQAYPDELDTDGDRDPSRRLLRKFSIMDMFLPVPASASRP